jgi:hypothetical protein
VPGACSERYSETRQKTLAANSRCRRFSYIRVFIAQQQRKYLKKGQDAVRSQRSIEARRDTNIHDRRSTFLGYQREFPVVDEAQDRQSVQTYFP